RGFSFLKDEPLDMRYHTASDGISAAEIVNRWSKNAIGTLLWEYGEERNAKRIAAGIVAARTRKKITKANELAEIIQKCVPRRVGKIHPATRTFQALRIAVNKEFENIASALGDAVAVLKPKGKIIVISFHSLEDRIVKNFFKKESADGHISILTPKPLQPHIVEINKNPRARSAKLRAAEKI
ncbi:MAG: 16S rRNA (cytosine(1402)-N(4))-methyltransferase RsmH, partial [Candidatus Taylorbacteria bacterium]|nr:16S rRNA (cytosine(1402)-N(4))-methyltransferase RsmH [Candidatus Taylorbacteria bacterium]